MSPENEVIIYAVRSFAQYLIQQGVIDENGFNEHMSDAEFQLSKNLGPEASGAFEIIEKVFGTITGNVE